MKGLPVLVRKVAQIVRDEGPRAATAMAGSRLQFLRNTVEASRRMRSLSETPMKIEQSLDVAFDFSIGDVSIAPAQIRSEIESLLQILNADPPRRVLEIGTARGGTLFLLSRVARSDAVLASIDLPGGDFGGSYRRESILLLRTLPRRGQMLRIIRADSHHPSTLASARRVFGGQRLDLLLIDGDHRYEGVRADLAMYGPLVRPGGRIALHDIVPGPADRVGGVPRLWQEIRELHKSFELVRDWNQEGFGIGVMEVPTGGLHAEALSR
jgi:predicted O-methyltransferase YrrM